MRNIGKEFSIDVGNWNSRDKQSITVCWIYFQFFYCLLTLLYAFVKIVQDF